MTVPTPDDDKDDVPHDYASPACFMHEVDPAYFGLLAPPETTARKTRIVDAKQPPSKTSEDE